MTNRKLCQGQIREIAGSAIEVVMLWPESRGALDPTTFILRDGGKTKVDGDMVFINQPSGAGGAVSVTDGCAGGITFTILPDRLSPGVERIVFCFTVDDGATAGMSVRTFDRVSVIAKPLDTSSFCPHPSNATERAIIFAKIYRRGSGSMICTMGQGFDCRLAPLAQSFGVDIKAEKPAPTAAAPAAVPARAPAPMRLKKITIEKLVKVSRDKRVAGQHPFIAHSGAGVTAGSETIVIRKFEELKVALFAGYSAVSNGTRSSKSFRPQVTLTDAAGNEVRIPLLNPKRPHSGQRSEPYRLGRDIESSHVETYNTTYKATRPTGTPSEPHVSL